MSQWHGRELTLQISSVIFPVSKDHNLQAKKKKIQPKPNQPKPTDLLKLLQTLKFHSLSAQHQKIVTFCCGK